MSASSGKPASGGLHALVGLEDPDAESLPRERRDGELHVARDSPERWWKRRPDQNDDGPIAIRRLSHGATFLATSALRPQTEASNSLGSGRVPVPRVARLLEVADLPSGVPVSIDEHVRVARTDRTDQPFDVCATELPEPSVILRVSVGNRNEQLPPGARTLVSSRAAWSTSPAGSAARGCVEP